MGIYYATTTESEDSKYILDGIAKGEISPDFYWMDMADTLELAPKKEVKLVWISNEDSRSYLIEKNYNDSVVINNVKGKLTAHGCRYIRYRLQNEKRVDFTV